MRILLLLVFATGAIADIRIAEPVARPGIGKPFPAKVQGPLVVAMVSPTCPLSRKFAPVLARLSARFPVQFIGVQGTVAELDAFSKTHGFKGAVRADRHVVGKDDALVGPELIEYLAGFRVPV